MLISFMLIRVKINIIKFKGVKQKTKAFFFVPTVVSTKLFHHMSRCLEGHLAKEKSQDKPRCKILLKINVTHQYSKSLRNTRKCFWY